MMVQSAEHEFEQAFSGAWPTSKWTGMTVLVACSGGADSVALLRCMVRLAPHGTSVKVAHYNHQLRGVDSEGDEEFVRTLASSLDVQCTVGRAGRIAQANPSQYAEASLRLVRYKFLEHTASELGARYIVTAHTADDQAETVLHRLCRGAGASGLRGIRAFRNIGSELVLARPMLNIWRASINAYLIALSQNYRVDSSNKSDRYTRNRIRNAVLPRLENVHANAKQNIVEASKNIAELYDFVELEAVDLLDRWLRHSASGNRLPLAPLQKIHPALRKEVLRNVWIRSKWPLADMTAEHWSMLSELISTQSPETGAKQISKSFPGKVMVRIDEDQIRLERA